MTGNIRICICIRICVYVSVSAHNRTNTIRKSISTFLAFDGDAVAVVCVCATVCVCAGVCMCAFVWFIRNVSVASTVRIAIIVNSAVLPFSLSLSLPFSLSFSHVRVTEGATLHVSDIQTHFLHIISLLCTVFRVSVIFIPISVILTAIELSGFYGFFYVSPHPAVHRFLGQISGSPLLIQSEFRSRQQVVDEETLYPIGGKEGRKEEEGRMRK
jgi:hypothetical protein